MDGINLKNVRLAYNINNEEHIVINNINIVINKKEFTVILGKSGCGKTSILRIIKGLEQNFSGQVETNNLKIAYIFQEPRLMSWLNVEDNISFSLDKNKINKDKINNLIKMVELEKFKKSYPHELSGGMQSRVSIARALAYSPEFLLMDEPFAALDYFTRNNMQEELLKLYKKYNFGVLFVTHSIDEAIKLADRILIMSDGQIKKSISLANEKINFLSEEFIKIKKIILEELK